MGDRAEKLARIAQQVEQRMAEGGRVVVATLDGVIDGADWLARRIAALDYPEPRIARGEG